MTAFSVKKGKDQMQISEIKHLLEQSYWAKDRSLELIQKSMEHSICYGVFENENNRQIGFARVLTDYATTYYICDVIIDSNYRGNGLGKNLVETIVNDPEFCDARGILATQDAHGLYSKFGFMDGGNRFMSKPKKTS
jgi:predicted GNAT family N-acyltransferase